MESRWILAFCLVALLGMSCAFPRWSEEDRFTRSHLRVDNPVVKIKAIRFLTAKGETRALYDFIELLEDDDPAVRGQAYWGIQQLTGLRIPEGEDATVEFNAYQSAPERAPIVKQWRHC